MLAIAINNLEKYFSVVGLSERFNDSLFLLRDIFHWDRIPFYVKRNVGPRKNTRKHITPYMATLIEKTQRFDMDLYRYANGIFDRQMKASKIRSIPVFFYGLFNRVHQITNRYE